MKFDNGSLIVAFVALVIIPSIASAQTCLTGADTPPNGDCNGIVEMGELLDYIDEWYSCSECVPDLFQAIEAYYNPPPASPVCDKYVAASGTSGSGGSPSDPIVATGNDVLAVGTPGDVVCLQSGYYGEIYHSGLANSDYITIQAQPGHKPGFKSIRLRSGSKWVFKDLTISPELDPTSFQPTNLIDIQDSNHMVIENNDMYIVQDSSAWDADDWIAYASGRNGVYGRGSNNIVVRNNRIKNVHSGILAWGSDWLVEYNTIENYAGDGMQGGNYQVFQYNTVKNSYNIDDNHDDGFQIGTGTNHQVTLRGNTFITLPDSSNPLLHGAQGIGLWDGPYHDFIIENNVVVSTHTMGGISLFDAQDSRIMNNIVFNPLFGTIGSAPYIRLGSKGNGGNNNITIRNNIAHSFPANGGTIYSDHNLDVDDHDWDALFVDYANLDFRHEEGSPAIDAGSASLAPAEDILGVSRPQGTGYDIGAYEHVEGAGNVYYVSPDDPECNMNGPGTAAVPWCTLQKVFETGKIQRRTSPTGPITNPTAPVTPGDTIRLRTGYHGVIDYEGWYNNEGPITIEADTGHNPTLGYISFRGISNWIFRNLKIRVELARTLGGNAFIVEEHSTLGNSHNIILENCDLSTASEQTVATWTENEYYNNAANGIALYADDSIVRNNNIYHVAQGILGGGDNTIIENNTIDKFTVDGLRFWNIGDNMIWRNNIIKNSLHVINNKGEYNHDDGMQIYAPRVTVFGLILSGNEFHCYEDPAVTFSSGCQGIGVYFGAVDGRAWIVENNLVLADHTHGITIRDSVNIRILNNTVVLPPNGDPLHDGNGIRTEGGTNVTVENNLIWGGDTGDDPWNGGNILGVKDTKYDIFVDYDNYNFYPRMDGPACDGSVNGIPGVAVGALPCTGAECTVASDCPDLECRTNKRCEGSSCVYNNVADGTSCDDGLYCNGIDTCQAGSCSHPGNPCPADGYTCTREICNEATDTCGVAYDHSSCNDNNECTDDSCMGTGGEAGTGCSYSFNTEPCDDGDACTTGDTCDGSGTCQPGAPITSCINDDGCCPANCNESTDNDCTTIPTDYVSYWRFDETGGLTAHDESGDHDGTLKNGAGFAYDAERGRVLSLDGTDDHVEVPYDPGLDLAGKAITISAWVHTSKTSHQIIIDKPYTTTHSSPYFEWALVLLNGDEPSLWVDRHRYTGTVPANTWTHVAATYDGQYVRHYLDGSLTGSIPESAFVIDNANSRPVLIGVNGGIAEGVQGSLDDVMVFGRALSASEIQQIYDAQV